MGSLVIASVGPPYSSWLRSALRRARPPDNALHLAGGAGGRQCRLHTHPRGPACQQRTRVTWDGSRVGDNRRSGTKSVSLHASLLRCRDAPRPSADAELRSLRGVFFLRSSATKSLTKLKLL